MSGKKKKKIDQQRTKTAAAKNEWKNSCSVQQ